jgi:hypothetical protein
MPHSAHSMAEFVALSVWQNMNHVNLADFASLLAFITLQSNSYFSLRRGNLVAAKEAFETNCPLQPHHADMSGFVVRFVGEESGPIALWPQGKPAWNYLYRKAVPALSSSHRVLAPDFARLGKNETPQTLGTSR